MPATRSRRISRCWTSKTGATAPSAGPLVAAGPVENSAVVVIPWLAGDAKHRPEAGVGVVMVGAMGLSEHRDGAPIDDPEVFAER